MANLLTAQGVTYALGPRHLVKNVDLQIQAGQFVALVGPNGAGKSTLLRILAGLLPASGGQVFWDGTPLPHLTPPQLAKRVAYVPQDTPVNFAFTVEQTVLMGRHPHLGRFQAEGPADLAIAQAALAATDMLSFQHRLITGLSGGERQRVFIAKALAQEPALLLLDEPISALDIRHQLAVLNLTQLLVAEGKTAVAVLHDLNLAARFCDRIVLMADGALVADGPPEVVLTAANIAAAYGVEVAVRPDPLLNAISITALNSIEQLKEAGD